MFEGATVAILLSVGVSVREGAPVSVEDGINVGV